MPEENSAISFERIVFFSDAVFAIVITLLVLEIKVPHLKEHSEAALKTELIHLLPKIFGFVCSFFIVGLMWFEHHRLFRYIAKFDNGLIWKNLIFLVFISFIPFPTALFSEYYWSQSAFLLYVTSFGLAALAKLAIWNHAVKRSLLADGIDSMLPLSISRRSLAVPIACGLCIILGFIVPTYFAFLGFPFIPLFAYLLDPAKKTKIEAADEIQTP
jgi:uncharacterized membrane protein